MAQFTRESALDYLQQRGLLTKARDSYTTAYAKRLASSYSKAEQSGKKTTRAAARGKAGPEHIVPNYQYGPLPEGEARDRFSEQYRVTFPETVSDLKPLKLAVDRRRTAKRLPKADYYTITVYGSSRYKHAKNPTGDYTFQTLALHITNVRLAVYLKDEPNRPILDWVNALWEPVKNEDEWAEIISISLKVGNV